MQVDKRAILDTIYDEPAAIGHWVGLSKLEDLHNDWLRQFLWGEGELTLQAHRGSYKTSCIALFLAIHTIIKPNESVGYFRKTDGNVAEVNREVIKILQTGAFREMVRILYGQELKLTKATDAEISTNLQTSIRGGSQIVGRGIHTSITGAHFDLICTDDIITLEDRVSKAERERTKVRFAELRNVINREGARFINAGTPWHKDDAFQCMKNLHRYTVDDTGLITPEKQRELEHDMSPSLYAANYKLKHIADEEALFGAANFIENTEENRRTIFDGLAHVDAAFGGADYTAYTVLKQKPDGRYTGAGKLWHGHIDDHLDEIMALQEELRAGSILIETNADKGYAADDLEELGASVQRYNERMNKHLKISTYLRKYWDKIDWLEGLTDAEYIEQIIDYTEKATHDDAPDSAASLLREMEDAPELNRASFLIGGW